MHLKSIALDNKLSQTQYIGAAGSISWILNNDHFPKLVVMIHSHLVRASVKLRCKVNKEKL